jgi:hypothetical protein
MSFGLETPCHFSLKSRPQVMAATLAFSRLPRTWPQREPGHQGGMGHYFVGQTAPCAAEELVGGAIV